MKPTLPLLLLASICHHAYCHPGHSHAPSDSKVKEIKRLNTKLNGAPKPFHLVFDPNDQAKTKKQRPPSAAWFDPFKSKLQVHFDEQFLYVESNGMPDHSMMVGITAWQQQVPIPQPYTEFNCWQVPLKPVPADNPLSAKTNFFRGAIALAVNGVPIFNPIKNNGVTDTFKAGELDRWGGHCGRADDYHYHVAPIHFEKIVGKGKPIAVALDGYPIYGYNDPNGKPPTDLDWLNGHRGPDGEYHYHATRNYPYLNGGFYGKVTVSGGQVTPQPRGQGIRPATRPLRGAKITGFKSPSKDRYIVEYEVYGEKRSIDYTITEGRMARFRFITSTGTTTETYGDRRREDRRPGRSRMR